MNTQAFLERNGYRIIKKQKTFPVIIHVDGKSHLSSAAVDYIATKENEKYVVKVELGQIVDPLDPLIYRKLIELRTLFPSHKILLLDPQNSELHEIKFEFPRPEKDIFISFTISLLILAAVMGIVFFFTQLKLF